MNRGSDFSCEDTAKRITGATQRRGDLYELFRLKDDVKRKAMTDYIKASFSTGDRSWDAIADKYIEFYKR